MFLRVCGFCTGNKISISITLWNSESPPCEETSGYSPDGRKKETNDEKAEVEQTCYVSWLTINFC